MRLKQGTSRGPIAPGNGKSNYFGELLGSPDGEAVFEVLHGAQAGQAAGGHDADARAQRLTLLHAVARQQHRVPCMYTTYLLLQSSPMMCALNTPACVGSCLDSRSSFTL